MNTKWKVLLIGGSSGVGKSHLARKLSEYYRVPLLELDDIRIALQQVVKETEYPDLFTFINTKNFMRNLMIRNLFQIFLMSERLYGSL